MGEGIKFQNNPEESEPEREIKLAENVRRLFSYNFSEKNGEGALIANIESVEALIPGTRTEDLVSLENCAETIDKEIANPETGSREIGKAYDTGYVGAGIGYIKDLESGINPFRKKVDWLKNKFKDVVVIDLGAGTNIGGYELACMLGAKGYIGIEPFNYKDLVLQAFLKITEKELKKRKIGTQIAMNLVKEDALTFLKRLPDNTVALFTFGTDEFILQNGKYIHEVEAEMVRVLSPESTCIIHNSMLHPTSESSGSSMIVDPEFPTSTKNTDGVLVMKKVTHKE
ncbi:MAG: hypothetical protein NT077_04170 [Candidatus Taylorbacteria bacterium]|nr:hypothetical protein [Candidatus Taylorbacteria bacterium]